MNLETIWDKLHGLGWESWIGLVLMLWIAYCVVAGAVIGIVSIVRDFRGLPPRQRVEQCLRLTGLATPGILFWAWYPEQFMSQRQFVAWLAWPILSYVIGHRDGKNEVQRKLDAIYEEPAARPRILH